MCRLKVRALGRLGIAVFMLSNLVGWTLYFAESPVILVAVPALGIAISCALFCAALSDTSGCRHRQPTGYDPLEPME